MLSTSTTRSHILFTLIFLHFDFALRNIFRNPRRESCALVVVVHCVGLTIVRCLFSLLLPLVHGRDGWQEGRKRRENESTNYPPRTKWFLLLLWNSCTLLRLWDVPPSFSQRWAPHLLLSFTSPQKSLHKSGRMVYKFRDLIKKSPSV